MPQTQPLAPPQTPPATAVTEILDVQRQGGIVTEPIVGEAPVQDVQQTPHPVPPAPSLISAAGSAGGNGAAPAPDLGALTEQIYERIERRLRSDLLFDRERKGVLADQG